MYFSRSKVGYFLNGPCTWQIMNQFKIMAVGTNRMLYRLQEGNVMALKRNGLKPKRKYFVIGRHSEVILKCFEHIMYFSAVVSLIAW